MGWGVVPGSSVHVVETVPLAVVMGTWEETGGAEEM